MLLVEPDPPGHALPGKFCAPDPFAERELSPNVPDANWATINGSRPNVGSDWICWLDSVLERFAFAVSSTGFSDALTVTVCAVGAPTCNCTSLPCVCSDAIVTPLISCLTNPVLSTVNV